MITPDRVSAKGITSGKSCQGLSKINAPQKNPFQWGLDFSRIIAIVDFAFGTKIVWKTGQTFS